MTSGNALTICIGNDRADIALAAAAVEQLMDDIRADAHMRYVIALALDELLTNVVSYGYPDGASGQIEVTVAVGTDAVTLTVADDGRPHDPFQAPDPPLDETLEARRIGGLGVHLVRRLMDTASHRRDGDRNVVTCVVARAPKQQRRNENPPCRTK